MILHNFECRKNQHQFELAIKSGDDTAECPDCGSISDIVWLSPRSPHRQLQTPIVMWRYSDGRLGVAGGADSKTPRNAERIEIRSIGEYRRHVKELNQQQRSKEERREERYRENLEAMEHHQRGILTHMMGQESDPLAKDIYREALERNKGGHQVLPFSEFFSMTMEMDRGNYEGD